MRTDNVLIDDIKNEPMFFSASAQFALDKSGPLTSAFLAIAGIPAKSDWIIDSRVHMLMEGWYPCIPGYHHDDVPRNRPDGQPDYDSTAYYSEHIMAIVDVGTGSFTEFVDESVTVLPQVPVGKVIYREWDSAINERHPKTKLVGNGEIFKFTWQDFHRGMPAVGNGWRWFIRASRNTKRPVLNELRNQVQVYMPTVTAGW